MGPGDVSLWNSGGDSSLGPLIIHESHCMGRYYIRVPDFGTEVLSE